MIRCGDVAIIRGAPFHDAWSGSAGLSLKHYYGGAVPFRVGRGMFEVRDDRYLLVNQGETYAFDTTGRACLRNFTWFLDPVEIGGAWRSMIASEEALLDSPDRGGPCPDFVVSTLPAPPALLAARSRFGGSTDVAALDSMEVAEAAQSVISAILVDQLRARGEVRRIRAQREATRREIYARLRRAVDFAMSNLGRELSLDEMAGAAFMSKFHFARRFTEAFGASPYAFVKRERMRVAADRLSRAPTPIAEIARLSGYSELSSFIRAFRSVHGVAPSAYRRAMRD